VGEREVLFETPSGVDVSSGTVTVPPHAGALLGPVTTFS
jgi:maltooligosyltrehalose trehalohydrolase